MQSAIKAKKNPYARGPDSLATSITAAVKVGSTRLVTVTMKDAKARPISGITRVLLWLSDAANGAGLCAAAPSGGIALATNGTILNPTVAGKYLDCQTDTTGVLTLNVTEATSKTFYVCITFPDGSMNVPFALAF